MTELEKQWKREEQTKWVFLALAGLIILFVGLSEIIHSINLLAAKCSL